MYYSFKGPVKAIRFKGTLLIPYYLLLQKAGYFVCEVHEGKLILTTFLFLTNNDTPEGDKLYRLYQLTRNDKDYLAINKLSSFVTSDIAQNPEAKKLFIDAGCESLFQIKKSTYMRPPEEQHISDAILNYINKK